jgi:alpha-L-fucosidase
MPWETCMTLNGVWGYSEFDKNWKTPQTVVNCLVNTVSKNGNLLLNVGPDAKGNFPDECLNILSEVGVWMQKNGESIYGCGASSLAKQDWGRYTQKGNFVYAHWLNPNLGDINAKGINVDNIKNIYMLHSNAELQYYKTWWGNTTTGNCFINVVNANPPDKLNTVIKIELNK